MASSETCEVWLFKNKKYRVSVSISLHFSRVPTIVCLFDTGMGVNHIRTDLLSPNCLESIHNCNVPEISSALVTKIKLSAATTILLRIGESHTPGNFRTVSKLVVAVVLRTTYIYRVKKSIHSTKRKSVSHQYLPLPILMV